MGNNPEKNALMRAQGAELVEHGRDFDEAFLADLPAGVDVEIKAFGKEHGK